MSVTFLNKESIGNHFRSVCLSPTDLCSGVDLPEVEIVSLLTEKLPRYTLQADHVFGYDHDDWLHTPLLPPEAALGLTYEQIDETFKYFCKSHALQNPFIFFFLLKHCLWVRTDYEFRTHQFNCQSLQSTEWARQDG